MPSKNWRDTTASDCAAKGSELSLAQQEPDRHQLDAVALDRIETNLATAPEVPPPQGDVALQVHHQWDIGAVKIGVQDPDGSALCAKSECQV